MKAKLLNKSNNVLVIETESNIDIPDGDLDIEIKRYKEKRSLDANAYMWALLRKQALARNNRHMTVTNWDCYLESLKKYGQFTYIVLKPKAVEHFKKKHNLKSYDPIKNLCKKVLLVSLNTRGDIRNASGAIIADIRSDWKCKNEADKKYVGLCFTKIDGKEHIFSKDICAAVLEHNYLIADYFYSDAGIMLQYRDSTIAQFVVDEFVAEGEAILVYHDSFIVRESLEQKLESCMKRAYKFVVGSDRYCKIDKK